MSEFKGTEGKWLKHVTPKHKIGVLIGNRFLQLGTIYEEDCLVASCCKTEEHANALLISKAPEMLEMLKIARDKFLDLKHDKNLPELQEIQDQIEQLIKEATQL